MKAVEIILFSFVLGVSCSAPSKHNSSSTDSNESAKEPSSIDIKELLRDLSISALELGDFEFQVDSNDWIGYAPAILSELERTEERLNVVFPADYKEFLRASNGFPATTSVAPSFLSISQVDYTKNLDPDLIHLWTNERMFGKELAAKFERSILIGGFKEEQAFLLIPPIQGQTQWEYWEFANWLPGGDPYPSLTEYFKETLEFNKAEIVDSE